MAQLVHLRRAPFIQAILHPFQRRRKLQKLAGWLEGERSERLRFGGQFFNQRIQAGKPPLLALCQHHAHDQFANERIARAVDDAAQAHARVEQALHARQIGRAPGAQRAHRVDVHPVPAALLRPFAARQVGLKGKDDLHILRFEGIQHAFHLAGAPPAHAYAQLQVIVKMEIGDVIHFQRVRAGARRAEQGLGRGRKKGRELGN